MRRRAAWMDGWAHLASLGGRSGLPRGFAQPETVEGEQGSERAMPDVSDLVAAAALLQQVNECRVLPLWMRPMRGCRMGCLEQARQASVDSQLGERMKKTGKNKMFPDIGRKRKRVYEHRASEVEGVASWRTYTAM